MNLRFCVVIVFAGCSFMSVARAEPAYITDSVTVGLFGSQDLSGEPVERLLSGARVEILQTVSGASEIKTIKGNQGWLRESFLTKSTPAIAKLEQAVGELNQAENELEEAHKKLKKLGSLSKDAKNLPWMRAELNKARKKAVDLEKELKDKVSKQAESGGQMSELGAEIEQLKIDKTDLEKRLAAVMLINGDVSNVAEIELETVVADKANSEVPLPWVVLMVASALFIGGGAVYVWFSQRLRRRFGGIKFY